MLLLFKPFQVGDYIIQDQAGGTEGTVYKVEMFYTTLITIDNCLLYTSLRDEGRPIEEVHAWAEEHKLNLHHWFFSTDLTFYIRGGRISKASGFFGTMLNICPLLNMDDQGKLIPRFKIRTKKKVIRAVVDKMEEYAEGGLDSVSYTHLDRRNPGNAG